MYLPVKSSTLITDLIRQRALSTISWTEKSADFVIQRSVRTQDYAVSIISFNPGGYQSWVIWSFWKDIFSILCLKNLQNAISIDYVSHFLPCSIY